MALTVRGSAFYFGEAVESDLASFPAFFQWIKNTGSNAQWPFIAREDEVEIRRQIYCNLTATNFYGIFLSARNAEFQHYIREEGGRIIVEEVSTEGNPPVEMNFFAMRLDSRKGLFSHYIGSYRFQQFMADLWASYKQFVVMKRTEEVADLDDRATAAAFKRYSLHGRCNYGPVYTPGAFTDLIERLGTISELRMTTYAVDGPADSPVGNNLKSVHQVYRLDALRADAGVKAWLREKRTQSIQMLASGRTVYNGSVVGEDRDGNALKIDFENTLEDFLSCQYDEIGTFELANLAEHRIIREMLNALSTKIIFRPAAER